MSRVNDFHSMVINETHDMRIQSKMWENDNREIIPFWLDYVGEVIFILACEINKVFCGKFGHDLENQTEAEMPYVENICCKRCGYEFDADWRG